MYKDECENGRSKCITSVFMNDETVRKRTVDFQLPEGLP
jgi:hypothetical protein